jgi:hypothetical protein
MYNKSVLALKAAAIAFTLFNASAYAATSNVDAPTVGSVEAWKHGKFPWMYPTTAHEVPSSVATELPRPGSIEAWKHAKTPWVYPTTAHEVPSTVSFDYPRPGTAEALNLAKHPGLYRAYSEKASVQSNH